MNEDRFLTKMYLVPLSLTLEDGCDARYFYAVILESGHLYQYHRTDKLVLYHFSSWTLGFKTFAISTPLSEEIGSETLLIALRVFAYAWNHRN